jgi:hypothetical protein
MRHLPTRFFAGLAAALFVTAAAAFAQVRVPANHAPVPSSVFAPLQAQPDAKLGNNQTLGYGNNHLLQFTYQQQFDCVVQPNDDRNYSGVVAALSPAQFNFPECQVGAPSTIDPTGGPVAMTDKLWVLVPFFETDPKQPAFTPALGKALKKLFGMVPDAFKIHPGEYVQCPDPKLPPGTCTMHPVQTDLGPVLTALKLLPAKTVLNVPLVNHSHLVANNAVVTKPEWWQVVVILVKDPKSWPNKAGTSGITSLAKLRAAQKAGLAFPDVPSNFFLFFSSTVGATSNAMGGMRM